jgi:hypothetical protein
MGPDIFDGTLQFLPDSKAIRATTPSPNATPKISSQNSKIKRYLGAR